MQVSVLYKKLKLSLSIIWYSTKAGNCVTVSCYYACLLGTQEFLCGVRAADVTCAKQYADIPDPPDSLEFLELVQMLMEEHNVQFTRTVGDAMEFYVQMVQFIEDELTRVSMH